MDRHRLGDNNVMKIVENIDRHLGKYAGISTTTLNQLVNLHNSTEPEQFDIVAGIKIASRLVQAKHNKADIIIMTEEEMELCKQDAELKETLLGELDASST